jgi:hypothetical protein
MCALSLFALAPTIACAKPRSDPANAGLRATITMLNLAPAVGCENATVSATVRNDADKEITLNTFAQQSEVLSLEIRKKSGQIVTQGPPPMPPSDIDKYDKLMKPGDELSFTYTLSGIAQGLAPGIYFLRTRGIASNVVRFRIVPARN